MEIPGNFIVSAELQNDVNRFLTEWNSSNDFITLQTSGSTGTPKKIELSKKGVLTSAENTIRFFKLTAQKNALLCLPLTTIGGKMMIIRSLISSMKLQIETPSANPLKTIDSEIDFIAVTPMQLGNILHESLEKIKKIKTILVGGAPISLELQSLLKQYEITVFHSYGMTETASHVALKRVGNVTDELYQALPGVHFSTNENQLLTIHYPALGDQVIQTTDQVELVSETSFRWIGRKDFVINSGGVKVHPEEIEQVLSSSISVPFFIAGIPDQLLGERVVVFVETEENISFADNIDFPKYGRPKEVICIPRFFYTQSGKIDRFLTRQSYLENKK